MTAAAAGLRPAWAEVDLGAIRHNARELVASTAPGAALCAIVKADGYGHGSVPVSRAALDGGATWLGVALVEEAATLREAGIDAPVLVLSEPPVAAMPLAASLDLRVTLYTDRGVEAAATAAAARGVVAAVHLKVDTGMHRVGAPPEEAVRLARLVLAEPSLRLEGVWTHFAVADEPDQPDKAEATARQLQRFDDVRAQLAAAGVAAPMVHTSNTAGALMVGAGHDLVRAGIGLYGYHPNPALPTTADLLPAMSIKAHVSHVARVAAGEAVSYGHRYRLDRPSTIATVPIGYADGIPRRLSAVGGEVLIAGRCRPIAGTVTMDQLMVDCGDDEVGPGDEVVLLGRQGIARITADDWARRLDTISYEILCGIGPRVPRVYLS